MNAKFAACLLAGLLCAACGARAGQPAPYVAFDLSGGVLATNTPMTELAEAPRGGWTQEYKTSKLVLRYIPAGTFVMGSPEREFGRAKQTGDENPHKVTLTQGFYIGIFEVTQGQWYRVVGTWPSYFRDPNTRESRPVEKISYDLIRKDQSWPTSNTVHRSFFMGRLRLRTNRVFDLPTEAQWEYACRAGTTNALNSGRELSSIDGCTNLALLGRFLFNGVQEYTADSGPEAGTAEVGSYAPNAWGLYDMHGNVWEWCLDHYGPYNEGADPKGAPAPNYISGGSGMRPARGGSWGNSADYCRAAKRYAVRPEVGTSTMGFRVAMPEGGPVEPPRLNLGK